MRLSRAPNELVAAMVCLVDEDVAQRAREVIFHGKRHLSFSDMLGNPAEPGVPAGPMDGFRGYPLRGDVLTALAVLAAVLAVFLGISAGLTETENELQAAAAISLGVVALLLFSAADS